MYYEQNYLAHFGVKGQKWGVRRFQNEDGSLTSAGKQRYYDTLSNLNKSRYNEFSKKNQERIEKKMAAGSDFNTAAKAVANRQKRINNIKAVLGAAAVFGAIAPLEDPLFRKRLGNSMKSSVSKVVNSNVVKKNAMRVNKLMQRQSMKRAGAVVLGKRGYGVR